MTKAFVRDSEVLHGRIPSLGDSQITTHPAHMLYGGAQSRGAEKYQGATAKGYDAKREDSEKWKREDEIVTAWLTELAPKDVLDCPVGTGRFMAFYEKLGCHIIGRDISEDMLQEAAKKAGNRVFLGIGDARDLDLPDKTVDVVICIRLMRWLETNEMQLQVISEMMRVAKRAVIFNVRTETGPLPLNRDQIDYHISGKGWKVERSEQIVEDFTMFMLSPQQTSVPLPINTWMTDGKDSETDKLATDPSGQ